MTQVSNNQSVSLQTDVSDPVVRFQVLRHAHLPLVKRIELLADGTLVKTIGNQIPLGSSITSCTSPLSDYLRIAFEGGVHQYMLPANVELGVDIPITPMAFVTDGAVDRTAKTLRHVSGPAVITLDHDPSDRSPVRLNSPRELYELLRGLFPAVFTGAAWGGYTSSSSNIYDLHGRELHGVKGFHLAFAAQEATSIKDFGDRLFKRLWISGYGYVAISRDGSPLLRTIFDKKPIEPQQPLFSGGALCIGCEQRREAPAWNPGSYLCIEKLPALTDLEQQQFDSLVQAAKNEVRDECQTIRAAYITDQRDALVKDTGMAGTDAQRAIEKRLGGTLIGSDLLHFDEAGKATVAEVLRQPAKYAEKTLCDPVSGDPRKAIFYMNTVSGHPLVFSQKHGGTVYLLKHDLKSLKDRLASLDTAQASTDWASPLPNSDLRPDERSLYFHAVKQKTGIGLGALRETVKEMNLEATQTQKSDLLQDPGLFIAKILLNEKYLNGSRLIQVESGYFWRYNGKFWKQVADSVIAGELQTVATTRWNDILEMWAAAGKKSSTLSSLVSGALASLGGLVVKQGDPLGLNAPRSAVMNFDNGEVWLTPDGPQLRPHNPMSYLTSCSPLTYDPEAEAPTFERALRGMLSHPGGAPFADQDDMLRHVEELLGYSIQTQRNLKAFVLVVGPGDNGKTKLTKLMTLIAGDDAIAFDRLSGVDEGIGRFASIRLVGKLILMDDDIDHEYLLPDGLLKKIAEEKPLTAEGKFKSSFQFTAQVVPWLLGNSWPRSRDLSRGMQTRANVIHLPRSFLRASECAEDHPDRQDPTLWSTVYATEMSGVVNRLIAGYYRAAQRNSFAPPTSAKRAFDMWLADANIVGRFIEEACQKVDTSKGGCYVNCAYEIFNEWCNSNGVQEKHRPQRNNFGKRFEELGYRVKHTNGGTMIYGVNIKDEIVAELQLGRPFKPFMGKHGLNLSANPPMT